MVHRLLCVGTVLSLLGGGAAAAESAKPKLIVRGVFRLDPATGEYQRNQPLSEEVKKFVATQAGDSFEVELDNDAGACGAQSDRETCFADGLKGRGWAAIEVDIGIGNDVDGIAKAPMQIYAYAPSLASTSGAARKALSEHGTDGNCALGRSTPEVPSECETFLEGYLKDWVAVSKPRTPRCPSTASKGRTVGGVIALVLGAGAVVGGGLLLNDGLQPRWLPDGCVLDGTPRQICQTYTTDRIAGGIALLAVGVGGIATGAGLLLKNAGSSSNTTTGPNATGGESACRK